MEVIPDEFIAFFNEWEVRVFIFLSLILQILLVTLGNRRKYVCKLWVRFTLWCAYLLADWVGTVSLGIISKSTLDGSQKAGRNVEQPLDQLRWFWAQFFLLHLGGPDTITAYALEDNELWLRHLVTLLIQTGLAFYILLVALPSSSWLPVLSILIFGAGLIKYGERVCALCAANSENFRDSMLTEPDPGPNYAKFMEEYTLRKAEGFHVEAAEIKEIPIAIQQTFPRDSGKLIPEAYDLFLKFKGLFAGAILSFQDRDSSQSYFKNLSPKQAFEVVEVELGFMFDELYTKASIVCNARGLVLRTITLSVTFFCLLAFRFLCDKSEYKKLDLILTYLLLVVAIFLELYAIWVLVNSDWTRNWLSKRDTTAGSSLIIRWFQQPTKKKWSEKLAQHNLLDLFFGDKSAMFSRSRKFLRSMRKLNWLDNYLEKHWYKSFVDVSEELKTLIVKELNSLAGRSNEPKTPTFEELESSARSSNDYNPTALWNRTGSFMPGNYDSFSRDWIEEREFDQRILLWHIATDICYTLEWRNGQENIEQNRRERKRTSDHSKHISDYMLYLLMVCPFMLPIGIGMIRFRDTCAEAKEFFEEKNVNSSKVKACNKLLKVNTEVQPARVKGDRSKSVLFDACRVAKSLRENNEQTWEIISKEWVRILAHAAAHCSGNHHAGQLRKGGELLTHVWLLMAHLGITEQFQIDQGHARAKLIVK